MKALLFDLDRTLADLQTYTDYGAALAEVQALVEVGEDSDTPATDWDTPTQQCMSILVALSGTDRWAEVSDLIAAHELRAVPQSHPMPGLEEAMTISDHQPRAVVTLLAEEPARAALRHHRVSIPVVVPRRADLRPKPAADQILEACRLLGVAPSETVMIGDSSWDAEAAVHAGCRFVGVAATKSGIARFGKEIATASNLVEAIRMASRGEG